MVLKNMSFKFIKYRNMVKIELMIIIDQIVKFIDFNKFFF